jgi:hypothetical protein
VLATAPNLWTVALQDRGLISNDPFKQEEEFFLGRSVVGFFF